MPIDDTNPNVALIVALAKIAAAISNNKLVANDSLPIFANNAAALAGGLVKWDMYRTGADPDPVCIVH